MRPSLLVTFLLFSILISQSQGIRLNKDFLPSKDHKIQKDVVSRTSDNGANVVAVNFKDEHTSGETRKLMARTASNPPTTSTSTTSKKDGNRPKASPKILGFGGRDESLSVDSTGPEHRDTTVEQYPDVIDLTGMDYSPAKRKPPIHN